MDLTGRIAVVTGASQGIGRACALKLARCGAGVALVARNQQKLEEVANEIARARTPTPSQSDSAGTDVLARAFPADLSDEEQIKATFKAVVGQFGKIDILVNNA
ncbi:MAG TPA: SDR family NAD(P)-dependent oxidoreductase, partial [Terriglobales bacterium]|nr:SDR family NAD(P)-dependent oxidoreductase [Terriglobales bacterium]